MNIKIASEKTGLTKKAIKYYEYEGLITPSKNIENNYRDYAEEDIVKLNLIGALRALDLPIKEIKAVIDGQKSLPEVFEAALEKINADIKHLEKSRLIIQSLKEKNLGDYITSGEQIRNLRETLELSRDGKKELLSKNLLRIFPGSFGEMFVIMYEPFLRVTVDNDEKEKVWLKLVEFLDSTEEVDENEYPTEEFRKLEPDKLNEFKTNMDNEFRDVQKYDEKIKNKRINDQIEYAKALKESDEAKANFIKGIEFARKLAKIMNPIQKDFEEYLCLLNEEYKNYRENSVKMMLEIKNTLKDKLDFDYEDLVKSLVEKDKN